MADEGVATKAPESDGYNKSSDKSIIPGDTSAQAGASMGVSVARQAHKHSIVELISRVRSIV